MSKASLPEILVRAAGGLVCSTLTGTVIWLLDANPHVIVIWSLIALAIGIIVSTQLCVSEAALAVGFSGVQTFFICAR